MEVEKLPNSQSKLLQLEYPYAIPFNLTVSEQVTTTKNDIPVTPLPSGGGSGSIRLKTSHIILTILAISTSFVVGTAIILECIAQRHDTTWQALLEGKEAFPSGKYIEGKKLQLNKDESYRDPKSQLEYQAYRALNRDKGYGEKGYLLALIVLQLASIILVIFLWRNWQGTLKSYLVMCGTFSILGTLALFSTIGLVQSTIKIGEEYQVCYEKLHDLATYHPNHGNLKVYKAKALVELDGTVTVAKDEMNEIFLEVINDIEDIGTGLSEHILDPWQDAIKRDAIKKAIESQSFKETKSELASHTSGSAHTGYHTAILGDNKQVVFTKKENRQFKESEFLSNICYICGNNGLLGNSMKLIDGEKDINEIVIERKDLASQMTESFDYNKLKDLYFCQKEDFKIASLIMTISAAILYFSGASILVFLTILTSKSRNKLTDHAVPLEARGEGDPAGEIPSVSGLSSTGSIETDKTSDNNLERAQQ